MEVKDYLLKNGHKVWKGGDNERIYINTTMFCTVENNSNIIVNGIDFTKCNLYVIRNIKAIVNGVSKLYYDVKENSFSFCSASDAEKKLLNNICEVIRTKANA